MADSWTPPPVGTPVWFEVPAVDVPATKKFYEALFPTWTWKAATEKYTADQIAFFSFSKESSDGLGGGIVKVDSQVDVGRHGGVNLYFLVASIEETSKLAVSLGATILSEKLPEGDHGFYQQFRDVAGNRLSIYEFAAG